jgi:hypothetical protein
MPNAVELLREGRTEELWQKCCGFIDLSMDEFMGIQRRLLEEQMELLKRCELGRKVMRGAKPRTVEEFREQVPITTYDDYVPYLPERREDVLPEKPLLWQHTAGLRCYSGEYQFKWVPVTEKIYRDLGDTCLAMLLLASCKGRGDVVLEEHDKFLYGLAPPPYSSGSWGRRAAEEGIFEFLPPLGEAEKMTFEERIGKGFEMGLSEGIDLVMAMSSVLIAVGDKMGRNLGSKSAISSLVKHGQPRILGAVLRSKLAHRSVFPRDLWPLKAVVSTGTDATVYRERIKKLWGRYPLNVYGSTETVMIAAQLWDYGAMTFLPNINFLEFISEDECRKWLADQTYRPHVFALDEVKAGQNYGIVITNFYGGALVRYFIGDVIKITSLRNEKLNVNIPQMVFDSRIDGIIDFAGFIRLSESTIWQAIENSGLPYKEWTVRKEEGENPKVHLYLELKPSVEPLNGRVVSAIHEQLKKLDTYYAAHVSLLDEVPLEVTLLPQGAFKSYTARQRAAGADLAHLKPPHMSPPEDVLERLMNPGL